MILKVAWLYFRNCRSIGNFPHTNVYGLQRMVRLLRAVKKATQTQITTRYNRDMQKCIWGWTSKQMSYSGRRPHQVPLHTAKNSKLRLSAQAQVHPALFRLMTNGFCSLHILIQYRIFRMWWNGRVSLWTCSWKFSSNCVMPPCQYGPKSLWHMFPVPCWIYTTKN